MKKNYEKKVKWVDIPKYEGLYQAGSNGQIRSIDRKIRQSKNGTFYERTMKGKILKTEILNSGYEMVHLCKQGKKTALTVHRLVASTFLGEPEKISDVNHIDGNKRNNSISNLEWLSRSDNIKHTYKFLNRKPISKKIICVETNQKFNSIIEASKFMNVNRGGISHVINGIAKSAGGYTWKKI